MPMKFKVLHCDVAQEALDGWSDYRIQTMHSVIFRDHAIFIIGRGRRKTKSKTKKKVPAPLHLKWKNFQPRQKLIQKNCSHCQLVWTIPANSKFSGWIKLTES